LPHSLFIFSPQGITKCNLKPPEQSAFVITSRRLAERHQLLPHRIRVAEELEVLDEILAFGGFGDVRCGTYMGHPVAVKTTRIPAQKDLQRIRKVSIGGFLHRPGAVSNILPSDFTGKSFSGVHYSIQTF